MKLFERLLRRIAWSGLVLALVACGNSGKGEPPEEKRVVSARLITSRPIDTVLII